MAPVAYAPQNIRNLYDLITVPGKRLSGILGDEAHFATGGYHVPRYWCKSTDYSVQLPADKLGDPYAACALDLSFADIDNHYLVSRRMLAAFQGHDPRIWPMREYFGSVDGRRVIGWDRHDPTKLTDDTPSTSDATHEWHGHFDWYRGYALDPRWVKGLADVINGVPLPKPPAPTKTLHLAWPAWMLPGHVFGDVNGPAWVHGGAYLSERDEVAAIQKRLIATRAVTGVSAAWADGRFEQPTIDATKAFQRKAGLSVDGLVGKRTWLSLFTY